MMFFVLVLGLNLGAGAQNEVTFTDEVFLPPTYYVGDEVELRVRIRTSTPRNILKPQGQSLPVLPWVEIRSVNVEKRDDGALLSIRFVSFASGIKTLPPLQLGDLVVDNLKIYTKSLLAGGLPDLAPARDQVLIPNTEIVLTFFIGILILIPFVVFQLWKPARKRVKDFLAWWEARRPFRHLCRDLKKLKTKLFGIESSVFYDQLSRMVRQYLSKKLHKDLLSATTPEIAWDLNHAGGVLAEAHTLVPLLKKADMIRFDHQDTGENQRLEDLEAVLKTALILEGKEGAHVVL